MPVESGISTVIQNPGLDISPLQSFAQQMLQAREMKRKGAEADLQAASQIAQTDPVLAEEIGGKAIKELTKHTGKSGSEMYFQNIYSQAQTQRQQQQEAFKLAQEKGHADITLSGAQAGLATSEAGRANAPARGEMAKAIGEERTNAYEQTVQDALGRLHEGKYDDTDAGKARKEADIRIASTQPGVTADQLRMLRLSGPELEKYFKQED